MAKILPQGPSPRCVLCSPPPPDFSGGVAICWPAVAVSLHFRVDFSGCVQVFSVSHLVPFDFLLESFAPGRDHPCAERLTISVLLDVCMELTEAECCWSRLRLVSV